LTNGLNLLSQYTIPEFKEALETLLVYTGNLVESPDEKKFRKIKLSNIHFQQRLGRLHGMSIDIIDIYIYIYSNASSL